MKKIIDSRHLLGVAKTADLNELKTAYRNLMKDCHPDKFQDETLRHEAEEKSKHIIDAYHFLVSIAPETIALSSEEYTRTTGTSPITDHHYKSQTLKITFGDGSSYEYFDVPRTIYQKFLNADLNPRFARRHIFSAFVHRRVNKVVTA